MKYIPSLLFFLVLVGCATPRYTRSYYYPPATFSLNRIEYNRLIVNRKSRSDLKHQGGCMAIGQIAVVLNTLDNGWVSGFALDRANKESLLFATVKVYREGDSKPLEIITDLDGQFKFAQDSTADSLVVEYLGYQTFRVNLQSLKEQLSRPNAQ